MLGPLRSLEEQRHDQQLLEIQQRRQERERRAAAEEEGATREDATPILEKPDDLTGPFHYEFSYWARLVPRHLQELSPLYSPGPTVWPGISCDGNLCVCAEPERRSP